MTKWSIPWPLLLLSFATAASESGPVGRQLADRDGKPAALVEYEDAYAPRVNFDALLEPADGIIHGAGQDPVRRARAGGHGLVLRRGVSRLARLRKVNGVLPLG